MDAVATIDISPGETTLTSFGSTRQFEAIARNAAGNALSGRTVTWTSTNVAVATINEEGLATALANGSTTIRGTVSGVSGAVSLSVAQQSASVIVAPSDDTLTSIGDTTRLSTLVTDANGHAITTHATEWASSDSAVVTVDGDGVATAVRTGAATVTATVGNVSGLAALTVVQVLESVEILEGNDSLTALGDTTRFLAEGLDARGIPIAGVVFSWSSSDTTVATVDSSGLVEAVGEGESVVTATRGDVSAFVTLRVVQLLSSIEITGGSDSLEALGDTTRFIARGFDAGRAPLPLDSISWLSSDPLVVTVDSDGLVEAVGVGVAAITAARGSSAAAALQSIGHVATATESAPSMQRSEDVSDEVMITVIQVAVSIGVTPATAALYPVGQTIQLDATVLDANGHTVVGGLVSWSSTDESIASVDGAGLVSADAVGAVTITASADDANGTAAIEVLANFGCAAQREIPFAQCEALVALYDSTNGAAWRNNDGWLTSSEPCAWFGVACSENAVRVLGLSQNNLGGALPPELGNLTELTTLRMDRNNLGGIIPPELGTATGLKAVDLRGNNLTGGVPPTLGNLTELNYLVLRSNALTGIIPPELGNLTNLINLDLEQNQLAGVIPREIGSLTNVEIIRLGRNQLTGGIPDEVWDLTNVRRLFLHDNPLSVGTFPLAGAQKLPHLEWLSLHNAGLSGGLPPGLSNLTNLRGLAVGQNQITGTIPPELGSMMRLESLGLNGNQLAGQIPSELGNLSNLEFLQLEGNALTGEIPPALGNLSKLRLLRLQSNSLSGDIPPQLGGLLNLSSLLLDDNSLTGEIPAELGNLTNLTGLQLQRNALTGEIPPELGNLTNLHTLELSTNALSGAIPTQLGNLTSLNRLGLFENTLTGGIPTELGNLTNLTWLLLHANQLSGGVPLGVAQLAAWIQSIDTITRCDLTGNSLSVPDTPEYRDLTNPPGQPICGLVPGG